MSRILEVSLSPALYPYRITSGEHITAVIDVLRFTTSLISAFGNGVAAVIPVSSPEEAEAMKAKGYPVAAELNGLRLPFADYGNSAADFRTPAIKGQTLVYSTTNGTRALNMAAENGPVVAAAFTNLTAVAEWLTAQDKDIVILCSGWKNLQSNEDALCAGALAEMLMKSGVFSTVGDEAGLVSTLWNLHRNDPEKALSETEHFKRLIRLGVDPLLSYTVQTGISEVIPLYTGGTITNIQASR